MTHSLIDSADLAFLLYDWLDVERLIDRATLDEFLNLSERVAVEHFLTHYRLSDLEEPHFDGRSVRTCPAISKALCQYAELGFFAAGFAEKHGGSGLPYLACAASFAIFASANIATMAYPMLTVANARLIATFGSAPLFEAFGQPQTEGRWFGTMCLSEPQAGSDLSEIRTRATFEETDHLGSRYRLFGNKMWISGGDHSISDNIVHLVLAKIPDKAGRLPFGTKGLSLFIVPKFLPDGGRNDVTTAGLNHKMGYRGTTNCLLNFGENDGAAGWLVGAPGEGLRQMFTMMNEARIGVGIGAASLAYRSYRLAANYARSRLQGRAASTEASGSTAIVEHPDVRRMLLQQKSFAEGALALCLYCSRLVDEQASEESAALLGLLTPIAKTWSAEQGLIANDIAIQIHGGYGYTRDFDVEQLWRDNRLNPIHEGTTGIQAIHLVRRKLMLSKTGMLILAARIQSTIEAATMHPDLMSYGFALTTAWEAIQDTVNKLTDGAQENACNNATLLLRAIGHVVVAWLWLDIAVAASGSAAPKALVEGKLWSCRYFFEHELPRIKADIEIVASANPLCATVPTEIFS